MGLNLIATAGRLIVRKMDSAEKSSGGILLAAPENSDIHFGIVESVGLKDTNDVQDFSVGQVVAWSNYSGVDYRHEGVDYLIINQRDIISIKSI